jgi:hypothetical protein
LGEDENLDDDLKEIINNEVVVNEDHEIMA